MLKPPNICIFCRQPGSSKQHIFPNRLRKILPRTTGSHSQTRIRMFVTSAGSAVIQPELIKHNGDLATKKSKRVCLNCNNGWLRECEEAAYPSFSRLILGEATLLNESEISTLRTQLATFTAVYDFDDKEQVGISQSDRTFLQEKKIPPEDWRIFIGRYDGVAPTRVNRIGGPIVMTGPTVTPLLVRCQAITVIAGKLLFHIVSADSELRFLFDDWQYTSGMAELPQGMRNLDISHLPIFNDSGYLRISRKYLDLNLRFREHFIQSQQ